MYHDAWFSCQITFCLCLVKTPTVCTGTRVPTTCKWMRRRKLMVWHYQRSYRTETMGISGGLYTCGFCVLHVSQCSAYGRVVSAHRVRMPSQTIGWWYQFRAENIIMYVFWRRNIYIYIYIYIKIFSFQKKYILYNIYIYRYYIYIYIFTFDYIYVYSMCLIASH